MTCGPKLSIVQVSKALTDLGNVDKLIDVAALFCPFQHAEVILHGSLGVTVLYCQSCDASDELVMLTLPLTDFMKAVNCTLCWKPRVNNDKYTGSTDSSALK